MGLKRKVHHGISVGDFYTKFDAIIAANLDLYAFWHGEYDAEFVDHVVKWHELNSLISLHYQEAAGKKG